MPLNKEANERLWNALIKEALIERINNELREINTETIPHEFSPEFENAIKKIKHSIDKKKNIKLTINVIKRIAVTAAVIVCIAFSALLTQPSVYAAVSNVIRNIFSKYDKYTYQGENVDEFDKNKQLGYIPGGYEMRSVYYSHTDVSIIYENVDYAQISFDYGLAKSSSISVDNERHNLIEFVHKGIDFYFYEAIDQNEENILIWYDNGYYYTIFAQLSQEEIVKIAESIK